jgi:hypothetical protein
MGVPWLKKSKVQEGTISRENGAFNFWDSQGIIMIGYLEQGRTINGTYNAEEVRRLQQEIAFKRRCKLTEGTTMRQLTQSKLRCLLWL